jgi:hypothetical protein
MKFVESEVEEYNDNKNSNFPFFFFGNNFGLLGILWRDKIVFDQAAARVSGMYL